MSKRMLVTIALGAALALPIAMFNPSAVYAGVAVSGRIVSPTGAVLSQAGGFVNFQPMNPGPGTGGSINSNGTFTISDVSTGQYQVQVSYGGNDGDFTGPTPFTVSIGSSAVDLGDIKLTMPSVVGTLTQPDGSTAVANGSVSIRTQDYSFQTGTGVDSNGAFKFGGLSNGTYIIQGQPPEGSEFTPGEISVTFSGSALTGQVVRLTTPNVKGLLKDPSGNALDFSSGGANCDIFNQDRTIQRNANVASDGQFRFGTMPTGSYTLECRPFNLQFTAAVPRTISVTSGTLLNVGEVRLTTAQVVGTVYAANGTTPVANANIQVHTEDWSTNSFAQSGQDGSYRVGGLSNGTYIIEVQAPWGTSGLVSPDPSTITIGASVITKNLTFVTATKFLSGKITKSNGTPVSGAMVNVNRDGGFGFSNATTDSNGNYSLSLSGGRWNVMVSPNMAPGSPVPDWFFSGPPQSVEFGTNTTTENKTLNITVEIANATITGRVTKADGSPMTQANVDVRNQEGVGNNGQVNPDGSFVVKVKAGAYKVNVFTPDNTLSFPSISVTVGENETKNVGTIAAKTKAAKITGKVVKSDGTGVANVYINAFMHGEPGWSNTQSDADGNFVLAVTSGRWGVNIDQGRNQKYVYSGPPIDVDVATDTSTVSAGTMTLTYADATITGSVVDTSGNVVTGFCAWVEARPATSTTAFAFGPGYGGPVNCQSGAFSISVPSSVSSTFTLNIHTPPNAPYSAVANQNVAVFANTTSTKNITVKANDATVQGRLLDQNGNAITSCIAARGWFGDVHFEKDGSWRGGEIRQDCTYSVSLLSGEGYHLGYFVDPANGFMMKPPDPTPITIAAGTTTMNITVNKADATITGRVVDPDGNGVDAHVFAGNWVEFEGEPNPENFKNELHADAKTNPDGTFSLGVLKGHRYEVGVGLPPGTSFIPADFQQVDMRTASSASVTLQLGRALGAISGTVTINNVPVAFGFVHCWEESGGFTGGEVRNGAFSVNYRAGKWHCGADTFDGTKFYRSDEQTFAITTQTSISYNFTMKESVFSVPPPVTTTFDAGTAQVISLENGTTITIPSGALGDSGSNVTVTATPTVSNLFRTKNIQPFGVGYDFTATDAENNEITTFNANVTVKFSYTDEQLEDLGIEEATLVSKFFDETSNTYQDPTGVTQDTANNTITIQTNHFTTFVMVSGASQVSGRGPADILATPLGSGGPQVVVADEDGKVSARFFAYASTLRIGIEAVSGDIDGDGTEEIITVPGKGAGPQVRVFSKAGKLIAQFFAYASTVRTGIHVATGDTDGDGTDEIITTTMSGAGPQVRIFNGSGKVLRQFFAYASTFRGGVVVAAGDVDGDGSAEIVTVPEGNGSGQVGIFWADGTTKRFMAYPTTLRGGFTLSLGDVDGDGDADIVVAPRAGHGPQVAVYDGAGKTLSRFFAFPQAFRGGVQTQVGDVDGDGTNEIIAMPLGASISQVRIFNLAGKALSQFNAYGTARGAFTFFAADLDGNGTAEIVTAPGAGYGPQVKTFNQNGKTLSQFMSHHPGFRGGVMVAPVY